MERAEEGDGRRERERALPLSTIAATQLRKVREEEFSRDTARTFPRLGYSCPRWNLRRHSCTSIKVLSEGLGSNIWLMNSTSHSICQGLDVSGGIES